MIVNQRMVSNSSRTMAGAQFVVLTVRVFLAASLGGEAPRRRHFGHFSSGTRPWIRIDLVCDRPAGIIPVIAIFGQGALLPAQPAESAVVFFRLWRRLGRCAPMVDSGDRTQRRHQAAQAIISGAFSLTMRAIQKLGLRRPRPKAKRTWLPRSYRADLAFRS